MFVDPFYDLPDIEPNNILVVWQDDELAQLQTTSSQFWLAKFIGFAEGGEKNDNTALRIAWLSVRESAYAFLHIH